MTPGTFPLILYRGDTYNWAFVLWQDSMKTVPTDLTGVTVASQMRTQFNGPVVYSVPVAIQLPNVIYMAISAAACAVLPQAAVWDLQLTYENGTVSTVLAGDVRVRHDVTNLAIP